MNISALAGRLGVSTETVRRDLKLLSRDGRVNKTHGVAALPGPAGEPPFERRMRENAAEKRAIARAVAATILDGESVMLDTGTTTSVLARALLARSRLTVVTNSSDIARTLALANGNKVYMAGGELRSDSGAALGGSAVAFIANFHVDHAIVSVGAIDEDGIMDYELAEAEFARMALTRATRSIVMADHSKFDRRGLVRICGFGGFKELFANQAPPAGIMQALDAHGVRLTLA